MDDRSKNRSNKGEKKMEAVQTYRKPSTQLKRTLKRHTNKFANFTEEDFKEANRVSKGSRGLSNITWDDLYREE
ncbi:hypothetical protein [Sporolactobacillus pectinivorans]|uniref:hypothetical protein n=1 Tax=Sporolactobacillus pectinivorans TaxID=1591408 RepID=UPI000C262ADF|nr:hypothetical protein [Sporolactobacillus pectinivorans]